MTDLYLYLALAERGLHRGVRGVGKARRADGGAGGAAAAGGVAAGPDGRVLRGGGPGAPALQLRHRLQHRGGQVRVRVVHQRLVRVRDHLHNEQNHNPEAPLHTEACYVVRAALTNVRQSSQNDCDLAIRIEQRTTQQALVWEGLHWMQRPSQQ